jgi:hypothetical protein
MLSPWLLTLSMSRLHFTDTLTFMNLDWFVNLLLSPTFHVPICNQCVLILFPMQYFQNRATTLLASTCTTFPMGVQM